jgi:DNA-binding CsgD family transcriptional regulator
MDHLLIVSLKEGLFEPFLSSFRQAGWRVTVTPDAVQAKAHLRNGDVTEIAIELDPNRPDSSRFKLLKHVHEFHPATLAIILNSGTESFRAAGDSLVQTIQAVNDASKEDPPMTLASHRLTPAQQRIAALVAQAYPNKEIARRLKIKEQSVRNELCRIFKKTGTWNRVELALLLRNGETETGVPGSDDNQSKAAWPVELKPPMDPSDQNRCPVF